MGVFGRNAPAVTAMEADMPVHHVHYHVKRGMPEVADAMLEGIFDEDDEEQRGANVFLLSAIVAANVG